MKVPSNGINFVSNCMKTGHMVKKTERGHCIANTLSLGQQNGLQSTQLGRPLLDSWLF
jgi:hypothetical protein